LFLIAIISTFAIALQNYFFASTAAVLTAKLRKLSFRAILRQDIEFFDRDEHSVSFVSGCLYLLLMRVVLVRFFDFRFER
jgi:ATP-binding cassette subfamily B (MDR/TAP) protein 1